MAQQEGHWKQEPCIHYDKVENLPNLIHFDVKFSFQKRNRTKTKKRKQGQDFWLQSRVDMDRRQL